MAIAMRVLSTAEKEALASFESMSVADVRERADAFSASHGPPVSAPQHLTGTAESGDQARALVADSHHRDLAEKWRDLERVMAQRGTAVVGDLPERDRLRWARRLNALSAVFSRPDPPQPSATPADPLSGQPPLGGLGSDDPIERHRAVRRLGETRRPASAGVLTQVLTTDPAEGVRTAAARALASVGGTQARTALLEASSDSPPVRAAIADALGLLREPAAVPKLVAWLASPTRPAAMKALGRIGDASAVPDVAPFLADPRRMIRSRARNALIDIGHPAALDALRADPRRNVLSQTFDTRASQRAVARSEQHARRDLPDPLDRVTSRLRSLAVKAVLVAAAIVSIDVLMLGVPGLRVLGLTFAIGALLTACIWFAGRSDQELLDSARWRAEPCAEPPRVAKTWSTLLHVVTVRPIAVSVFIALPLACDALLGGLGIVPGLIAALLIGQAFSRARAAQLVDHWQSTSRTSLLVERTRASDPIERLRVFANSAPDDRHRGDRT